MSRSRRKTPISPITTAVSDKPFKVLEHRAERRATRVALANDQEPPHRLSYGDPWDGPKDGKQWHGSEWPWAMRK